MARTTKSTAATSAARSRTRILLPRPLRLLIHSNVDRLRARCAPGHAWRLDPEHVYGVHDNPASTVNAVLQPWAGGADGNVRPWSTGQDPSDPPTAKTSKDPTIVAPPQYDR